MFRNDFVRLMRRLTREQHEQVLRYFTMKELCCDVARRHATDPHVIRRYEEIAQRLFCKRAKPLSLIQQIAKNKILEQIKQSDHAERLWERDLAAVVNDPSYTLERRREALRQFEEIKNEHEQRREELDEQLVSASLSPTHFAASAVRLAYRRRRFGQCEFFSRLDATIRRYLKAQLNGATWASSLPLLHMLALEWHRNQESLRSFLEGCFQRWEETTAPMGTQRQNVIMHGAIAGGLYRVINGALEGPFSVTMKEVPAILSEMKAISPAETNKGVALYDRLRRRSSRNIKAATSSGEVLGHSAVVDASMLSHGFA